MAKESPTLADAMIREWLRPQYRHIERTSGWLAHTIAQARKFVLDDAMSAFLGDLAYASLLTCDDNHTKACQLTETMRQGARLPHPLMWIEYNMEAKKKRVREVYGSNPRFQMWADDAQGPQKCGWLVMQHPQIDTAFMALECASHSYGKTGIAPIPQPTAMAYTWRSDDSAGLPWARMPVPKHMRKMTTKDDGIAVEVQPAGFLTGILSYDTPSFGLAYPPHVKREFVDKYLADTTFDPFGELASDARYLWSLLATINDLPVKIETVRPSKGYVARGNYRRFVEHSTVTILVPAKAYQRVATRAIAIARRRRHPVRGHWRKDWKLPLSPLCDHTFKSDDAGMTCTNCRGRKLWITEHERGDASLGYVLHDYKIKRNEDFTAM